MSFADVIDQQWSDYPERHRNRTSLLIHIVAVPVLWVGAFQVLGGLFLLLLGVPGAFAMLFWAAVLIGGSLFAQGRGHAMEAIPPGKVGNAADFAQRVLAEQFVNFPRFVLTGIWLRHFKGG